MASTTTTEHASAPAPKSGSSFTVTWGLLSIPVKLFTGTEAAATVKRSKFTPEGHPVGSRDYDKETGDNFDGTAVMKTAVGKDEWVELSDEELADAIGETVAPGTMTIEAFVPLDTVGTVYVVEKVDQVRPAERKIGTKRMRDEAADKAFALLCSAMEKRGVAALVTIPRRGAYSYGVIMPDGRFIYLLFNSQVREAVPMPDACHSDAELSMAMQLIDGVGVDTPVLEDKATERVRAFVNAKASGKVKKAKTKKAADATATVDLTAALAASLKLVA